MELTISSSDTISKSCEVNKFGPLQIKFSTQVGSTVKNIIKRTNFYELKIIDFLWFLWLLFLFRERFIFFLFNFFFIRKTQVLPANRLYNRKSWRNFLLKKFVMNNFYDIIEIWGKKLPFGANKPPPQKSKRCGENNFWYVTLGNLLATLCRFSSFFNVFPLHVGTYSTRLLLQPR